MAASFVRTCTRFSALKQPICDAIKKNQIRSTLTRFTLICSQCRYYHMTMVYCKKKKTHEEMKVTKAYKPKVTLPEVSVWRRMTVRDIMNVTNRPVDDVLDALFYAGSSIRYNQSSVIEELPLICSAVKKMGLNVKIIKTPGNTKEEPKESPDAVKRPPPDESVLVKRRPIVTIMGHVDHGKTTLLDTLRNTCVVETEFGGITQHIGAFNVTLQTGEKMTFLDTPGHAAFSAMRARGAKVTDIVVLVVAADDGVMEQTVQSIRMAKEANVPIIVAVNKIDKPDANIARTHNMLAQHDVLVEELGGEVQSVNISALQKMNINTLVEAIALQADLINLKGDPTGLVEGAVIESSVDVSRGKLATVLIQRGTLRRGAVLVSGSAWAKVRSMFDHAGRLVKEANLSDAVQILGWRELPFVGDDVLEVESEKRAHAVINFREAQRGLALAKEHQAAAQEKYEEHLIEYKKQLQMRRELRIFRIKQPRKSESVEEDPTPKLNVIIKGDVVGSVEAILDVLGTYGEEDKCRLNVVHYGAGPVNETDVELAETFNAIIYNFNVNVLKSIQDVAASKDVSIRPCNVIYKLVDDVKREINSRLPVVYADEVVGEANIAQEFEITEGKKKVKVAGCRCVKGVLKKSLGYRVERAGEVIYKGSLASMRHLKEEVDTIKLNVECGLKFKDVTISFQPGDVVVCYKTVKRNQEIKWDPGF